MTVDLSIYGSAEFCYLTTQGRVTGKPHTIEIWFALASQSIYMLAGGGHNADWIKNSEQYPQVTVRINEVEFGGRARVVTEGEEDALARRLIVAKYQPSYDEDLGDWGRTSLPVAVDLEV